jgi:RNA polymerase subunit RPABC4/transcription elongation factor Spt4
MNAQNKCPNCGSKIEKEFNVCPICKESLKKPCHNCSEIIEAHWNYCPYCEKRIKKGDDN